jgi:hypothetical protein
MRRLLIALLMRRLPSDRSCAWRYLLGRHPLAAWEEELILTPRTMLREGPTEVSGIAAETECPASHWDLKPDEACYVCGAAI